MMIGLKKQKIPLLTILRVVKEQKQVLSFMFLIFCFLSHSIFIVGKGGVYPGE